MEYLATRNVMHVVVDSPSMGPIPDLQEPTHIAGLKHGMIFTEGATNLTDLPPTGAFYCAVGPRHADCAGSETRALAILDKPLAERLIDSVKHRRVIDLSPVLHPDLPLSLSGVAVGAHRQPYVKGTFGYNPNVDAAFNTHIMDSHTGTHLVPPSYALPPKGFDNGSYAPHVRRWLADYERTFGPRGTSSVTTEQVPLEQTCGPARVIDVRHLVGTTSTEDRPISPVITPTHIAAYEKQTGALRPNEVVIFFTGHTDRHLKRMSDGGSAMMDDPFSGKSEGWPAPGPETIRHLDGKGIRCVATDAPTLGGVDPPQALLTYWTLGTAGMVGVEFLIDLEKVPDNAYFLFAAPKIRGGHGGVGRAIALH
jgi:kynurenine formamidase